MKRIFKVLLSLYLVFCLLPSYAFAANTTYELDELGMSIEFPTVMLFLPGTTKQMTQI